MFVRVKEIGASEYLYLVENVREGGRHVQRVIKSLGRRDEARTPTSSTTVIWNCRRSCAAIVDLAESRIIPTGRFINCRRG